MRLRLLCVVFILVIVALLIEQGYFASGDEFSQQQTLFIDTSRTAGITHNRQGIKKAVGQAWGDFDQDGFLDLYVANWSCYPDCGRPMYGDADHLYRNQGDGIFEDVSALLGADCGGWFCG